MDGVLLISWGVPPETSGSSIIVGSLAKQFSREEMIVVGERPFARPSVHWKDDWPEVVCATKGWPTTRRGARWWRRAQLPWLLLRCVYLARMHGCTKVVAVFPNEEFLLVGYLTAKLVGAWFYPYFHNTLVEQYRPGSFLQRVARWFQEKIFKEARHVFVMSEGMVELYRERYPDLGCSALVHSFNEDIPEFLPPPASATPLRFVMSGNINASCTDAAVRLSTAIGQIDSALTILSGTPKEYLEKMGIVKDGVLYETVSRDSVMNYLHEADIVLLPHGFTGGLSDDEYRTIFPTKTIEYLICGRPILAHAPPDCFLSRFLRSHQCALVVDQPDVRAILEAVRRLREDADLRAFLVRNALLVARSFHAPTVAARLRSLLDQDPAGRTT